MPDIDPPSSWSSSSCAVGEVTVTLTPYFQKSYDTGTNVGYRLKIVAWNACGMDDSIFRYYKKPINPSTGIAASFVSGVCSWPDMEELPQDEPEDNTSPSGFRLNYLDIVVDSETMATEVWSTVQEQVQELVQSIKDGQILETQAPVRISAT
jgi:hypothetical protein